MGALRDSAALLLLCCLVLVECVVRSEARIPSSIIRLRSEQQEIVTSDGEEAAPGTTRPIIGILSQPGDAVEYTLTGDRNALESMPVPPNYTTSYIAASYVKFVEMGGARAVPLIYNEPEEVLREKFAAINGILFPGGGASLTEDNPFFLTAQKLFNWAVEANDRGDHFPVYGVCLGFELLSILVSKNHHILERFEAENSPSPLLFVDEGAKTHGLFEWVPLKIINELHEENLAMQNHRWGLSPKVWYSTPALNDFFRVLTVTPDRNNKLYVSTVEAREYPFLGVQWHPEKNAFEWALDIIPHSADAIKITQSVANFFISEARKSSHKPASVEQEKAFLFYNYDAVYVSKTGKSTFDQVYIFE